MPLSYNVIECAIEVDGDCADAYSGQCLRAGGEWGRRVG